MKNIFRLPVILSSVIVTGLLFGIQRIGGLETLELKVFDQMMQIRSSPSPDPRLLIVEITEDDLKALNFPISSEILNNLLGKLEEYQPRAIGLDIIRDLPVEPGHEKLLRRLQQSDIIVPICKHPNEKEPAISPPKGLEPSQIGFADLVEDPDGSIRRNLLIVKPKPNALCTTQYSLSLQLAMRYLAVGSIQPQLTSKQELQLGKTIFKRLESNSGAYQDVDSRGYQILLNLRHPNKIAQKVTISQVLSNQVKADLVKDRIVLIGSTAPSLRDYFNTSYSSGKKDDSGRLAGVAIHAESTSQILSAVLNQQPLFWFIPEWGEVGWILIWSLTGGIIASVIIHPLRLGIVGGVALALLFAINFAIFTQTGWIPVISPALGVLITGGSVLALRAHEDAREREEIENLLKQQEEDIEKLRALRPGVTRGTYSAGEEISSGTLLEERYKIIKVIGSGGFGRTYLAEDTKRPQNPECVVKQLRSVSENPQFLEISRRLFRNEGKFLELLGSKHDQIPLLLAYFEDNHHFFLVQEYIKGTPLDKVIINGKQFPEAYVMDLLKDVLNTLAFVHENKIIHRDIKPGNLIRRDSDKRIVLIDFGAVKHIQPLPEDNLTSGIGTKGYAPPEQLAGQPVLSSDIYALGIIAIQALTGIDPRYYQRDVNSSDVIIPIQMPVKSNDDFKAWYHLTQVNFKLVVIINKMTEYNYQRRYQSVTEVLDSLENL
jgi:CHASE2 domain-containing sensor protein/predicted Ser/Thr protein kinase